MCNGGLFLRSVKLLYNSFTIAINRSFFVCRDLSDFLQLCFLVFQLCSCELFGNLEFSTFEEAGLLEESDSAIRIVEVKYCLFTWDGLSVLYGFDGCKLERDQQKCACDD